MILSGRKISPFRVSSATVCAAVPSLANFDEGRGTSLVNVTLAAQLSHMFADDGEHAACWLTGFPSEPVW